MNEIHSGLLPSIAPGRDVWERNNWMSLKKTMRNIVFYLFSLSHLLEFLSSLVLEIYCDLFRCLFPLMYEWTLVMAGQLCSLAFNL